MLYWRPARCDEARYKTEKHKRGTESVHEAREFEKTKVGMSVVTRIKEPVAINEERKEIVQEQ